MLRTLLRHTGGATFVERIPGADDAYLLVFEREGRRFAIAWTNGADADLPLRGAAYESAVGEAIDLPRLSGAPVYLLDLTS
jgi:hypothetical protein